MGYTMVDFRLNESSSNIAELIDLLKYPHPKKKKKLDWDIPIGNKLRPCCVHVTDQSNYISLNIVAAYIYTYKEANKRLTTWKIDDL